LPATIGVRVGVLALVMIYLPEGAGNAEISPQRTRSSQRAEELLTSGALVI
jgi:hypothetical protein